MKKRGLITLGILSLTVLASIPTSISVMVFSLPDVYQYTFYGAMKGKIERFKNASKKRIVVIGGSSVPFSLDCNLIKKELPEYEPVDFGLYATLGTNLMLDLASKYVGEGDIVIISPEISKQTLSMYYDGLETYKALEQNKDLLFGLDKRMNEALVGASASYLKDKLSYLMKNALPTPKDIYASGSFNEYGDIEAYRDGNIMLNGVDSNNPIKIDTSFIDDSFIQKMNDFAKTCQNRHISTYYRFSPMNDSSIQGKNNLSVFYDYLNARLSFQMLGDPYEASLEKEWFYDTNYHLNSYGAKKWTKRLIQDIKLTLDDTSITEIDDPEKPSLIGPIDQKEGDNTFKDCFAYEVTGDEARVVSLIKEEEIMTIPYRYEGKIITSFAADVFKNSSVKEVTIQDNVRLLYDDCFSASNVERIILDNNSPNSIGVGDHLLDGCNANIYVKQENVSAYKTSYNWSKYASRIKAIEE